ncbi:MAG: hypothetical protein ABI193_00140 [Minicystis sp.]
MSPGSGESAGATGASGGDSGTSTGTGTSTGGGGGVGIWSKSFGDPGPQWPLTVAVSAKGTIAVSGSFAVSIDFGGGIFSHEGDSYACFIATFDAEGNPGWSRKLELIGESFLPAPSLAFDAEDLVIAGGIYGMGDLGGGPLTSAGGGDVLVARFDSQGAPRWASRFGDENDQRATSVAVDPSGAIVVTGIFSGGLDFGKDPLAIDSWATGMFLARLDPQGKALSVRGFASGSFPQVGVDAKGTIVLTGAMEGTIDFGLGPVKSKGFTDLFVARFDAALNPSSAVTLGDGGVQWFTASAVDPAGDVVFTGFSNSEFVLGGASLFGPGGSGGFAFKLDAKDQVVWSRVVPQPGIFGAVALDTAGQAVLSGSGMLFSTLDASGKVLSTRSVEAKVVNVVGVAATPAKGIVMIGVLEGTIDLGAGPLSSKGMEDVVIAAFPFE